MRTVTAREARKRLSELLDAAEAGEEILIERRGQPAARLVPVARRKLRTRARHRAARAEGATPAGTLLRSMREDDLY